MSVSPHVLRLGDPSHRRAQSFDLRPEAATLDELARALDLSALRKVRFQGDLRPLGKGDWELTGTLGATMIQPCGVTLTPVTTRIDEPVERRYVAAMDLSTLPAEVEMPEDVSVEPLPAELDLSEVMIEALTLAVPPFPRADGAELGEAVFTAKGTAPMTDEDARPFAGLRDKLAGKE